MEAITHEHKKQLHDRVTERSTQLKAELAGLQGDAQDGKSDRARAVQQALAALETHVRGGWETIDEQESAALTRWLETSRFLFDTPGVAAPGVAAPGVAAPEVAAPEVATPVVGWVKPNVEETTRS